MNLQSEMTPAALAEAAGYTTQTINKWVRQFGWKTAPLPGVKGGRARVIIVDEQVRQFLYDTRRGQFMPERHIVGEPVAEYGAAHNLEQLLLGAMRQLSDRERELFSTLLMREGINGILERLGIKA